MNLDVMRQKWRKVKKLAVAGSQTQDISGLSRQCTSGTERLSHTPGSHSECAVRTLLGVNRKILFIRKEPMLRSLLTLRLNAQIILPHAGKKAVVHGAHGAQNHCVFVKSI